MDNTIRFVDELQAYECVRCGMLIECPRYVLRDVERRIDFLERRKREHQECSPKSQKAASRGM